MSDQFYDVVILDAAAGLNLLLDRLGVYTAPEAAQRQALLMAMKDPTLRDVIREDVELMAEIARRFGGAGAPSEPADRAVEAEDEALG